MLLGVGLLAAQGLTGFRSDLWRPLLWGIPAALIVAGAVSLEPVRALRPPRPLLWLGDASYAIYLCHFIAVAAAARLVGVAPDWRFVPAAVALSLVAGFAFHRWVEQPLIAGCRTLPGLLSLGSPKLGCRQELSWRAAIETACVVVDCSHFGSQTPHS